MLPSSLTILAVCTFLLPSYAPSHETTSPCRHRRLPPSRYKGPPMGRKSDDPDELLARAKANGYRREEHREKDAVPDRHAHIDKTIYDQDGALRRYVVFEGTPSLVYMWAAVLT